MLDQAVTLEADEIIESHKAPRGTLELATKIFTDVKILVDTHGFNTATLCFTFRGEPKRVQCHRLRDAVAKAKQLGIAHLLAVNV